MFSPLVATFADGLNPYSNGMTIESETYDGIDGHRGVLILILME